MCLKLHVSLGCACSEPPSRGSRVTGFLTESYTRRVLGNCTGIHPEEEPLPCSGFRVLSSPIPPNVHVLVLRNSHMLYTGDVVGFSVGTDLRWTGFPKGGDRLGKPPHPVRVIKK